MYIHVHVHVCQNKDYTWVESCSCVRRQSQLTLNLRSELRVQCQLQCCQELLQQDWPAAPLRRDAGCGNYAALPEFPQEFLQEGVHVCTCSVHMCVYIYTYIYTYTYMCMHSICIVYLCVHLFLRICDGVNYCRFALREEVVQVPLQ